MRLVQRATAAPSDDDVRQLLAAGWCPSPDRVGRWVDAAASGDALWWTQALRYARRDGAS